MMDISFFKDIESYEYWLKHHKQQEKNIIENIPLSERIATIGNFHLCKEMIYITGGNVNYYSLGIIVSYYFPMNYKHGKFYLIDEGSYYHTFERRIKRIITNILKTKTTTTIIDEVVDVLKSLNYSEITGN